jgi:histidinol-phosphate aminotransferase
MADRTTSRRALAKPEDDLPMIHYDPGVYIGGHPQDWLALHRNENLFVPAAWGRDQLKSMLPELMLPAYPDSSATALRKALAELHEVTPEEVYVGNGADGVLDDLFTYFRKQYEEVALSEIGYFVYKILAHRLDFSSYTIGWDELPGLGRLAALLVFDSPNAVTGAALTADYVKQIASATSAYVIWDNVYGQFSDSAAATETHPNVITVHSFSKFYALAAMRVGYCIAQPSVVSALTRQKDVYNVGELAQLLALRALADRDCFHEHRSRLVLARDQLRSGLRELGFTVPESHGNFVWAVPPAGVSAMDLQEALLRDKIAVRHFDFAGADHGIRITIPPPTHLERLLRRIALWLTDASAAAIG